MNSVVQDIGVPNSYKHDQLDTNRDNALEHLGHATRGTFICIDRPWVLDCEQILYNRLPFSWDE